MNATLERNRISSKEMVNQLNKNNCKENSENTIIPKLHVSKQEEKYCKLLKELHTLTYNIPVWVNVRVLAKKHGVSNCIGTSLRKRNIIESIAGKGSKWISIVEPNLVLARLLIEDTTEVNKNAILKKKEIVLIEDVKDQENSILVNEEVDISQKTMSVKIQGFLEAVYNDGKNKKSSSPLFKHIEDCKLGKNIGVLLYSNNIVQREGHRFTWILDSAPTTELVEELKVQYKEVIKKDNVKRSKSKSKKQKVSKLKLFINLIKNLFV